MYCFHCGAQLTEQNYCPNCRADVSVYKRVIYISNYFYNEGLEKANVRDLSGAINSLRQSIRFNKNNVEARNLLGLVYYEMGEVVAALSEWVISTNIMPKKNVATEYLNKLQNNQARLESINQTIKKYNQALAYCYQDSLDLAVIQLKKVLSLNPHFVRAHQLLALLYIHQADWNKARKELVKCRAIDTNNTTTLRYLKEVETQIIPEPETTPQNPKKAVKKDSDVIKYQSGNETIIQPAHAKNMGMESPSLSNTLINLGLGALVGAAIVIFLVMPARVQSVRHQTSEELKTVSEQSDAKTATISENEQAIADLTETNTKLNDELDKYKSTAGALSANDALFKATATYLTDANDIVTISDAFTKIDIDSVQTTASSQYMQLYNLLYDAIRPKMMEQYYNTGLTAYRQGEPDYTSAIENLELAVKYGNKEEDANYGNALYYLADSYYEQYKNTPNADKSKFLDNLSKAQSSFSKVKTAYPNTRIANDAESKLQEISLLKTETVSESDTEEKPQGAEN